MDDGIGPLCAISGTELSQLIFRCGGATVTIGKDEHGRNVKNRQKSHASESPVLLVIATWWERNPNSS